MLPFTADVLHSVIEQYNRAIWPAQIVTWALGLALLLLTVRPVPNSGRLGSALLAVSWAGIGVVYHLMHFATINFAAPAFGAAFILQGLLLGWSGAVRGTLAFRFRQDLFGWCGLALMIFALVGAPLTGWIAGHGWQSLPLFGAAPGPTAIFTIGLLLLTVDRTALHLVAIPLLWCLAGGATAWLLSLPEDLALPLAGVAGVCLVVWKNGRRNGGQTRRRR